MRAFLILLLISSCGYHFQDCEQGSLAETGGTTVSIPYIEGDSESVLNTSLIQVLASSSQLDYRHSGGTLTLHVAVIKDTAERIGYRYDRNPITGTLKPNILGTENRRTITVEVKLIDSYTDEVLVGPIQLSASGDYDYVETSSIRDLTFTTPGGSAQTVIDFSLGQLDSIEGASDDVRVPIYQRLAAQIVKGICSKL